MAEGNDDKGGGLQQEGAVVPAMGYARIESVETKKGKTILNEMCIDFPEGAVTAILGPSGSGKTTLSTLLCTNSIPSNLTATGEVQLSGTDAFVPQDDRLHGFFTCKSYLRHYSRLSGLPLDSEAEKDLLASLGLQEQSNTIVGDIFLKRLSGGQKRRLSVALEALTRPKNFYLDEVTSGLDAESALQVMLFLKRYVRASPGRRVILTIHQPSSFIWETIDNVVLLSKGKLVYQGPRENMESFFKFAGFPTPENYNPADHYVTAVNDEFQHHQMEVDEWASKYTEFQEMPSEAPECNRVSQRSASMVDVSLQEEIKTYRAGPARATLELTRRYFLNLWFNPGILGTRVAMYSMLALMVGALFWDVGNRNDFASIQSRAAVLFYCVAFFIFMSVAVLPFTVIERAIVDKEVRNSYYHPAAYQLAQAIATIPGAALLAFLVTLIIVPMLNLRDPLWYFLNMFLSLFCAESLAQLVSHVVPHFVIGMALIAGMYGFFMLFMGFMLLPSDFPGWLRWTHNVAFHTYSWRAFMYSEFCCEDQEFDAAPEFENGLDVLTFFEIEDVVRGNDMVVLLCYGIIIHLMSFVVLHAKYNWFKGSLVSPKKQE